MNSAHFPLLRVLGDQACNTTAPTGPEAERGSARRPRYGGGGPAGGVLLSCLTPHSTFQRVRAGKPPLHSNYLLFTFNLYYSPFTFYFLLFTFHFLLFTVYFLLFTSYFLLFTFYFLLFTSYFLLLLFTFILESFHLK